MFNKILIANRGKLLAVLSRPQEDASLLKRSVYSDADGSVARARCGPRRSHIGPTCREPFLYRIDNQEAVRNPGPQGCAFRSYMLFVENSKFAEAPCRLRARLVGPPVGAIEKRATRFTSRKSTRGRRFHRARLHRADR